MERAFSVCGTIEYMAPEIVEGGESGHDKVIYAFILHAKVPAPPSLMCFFIFIFFLLSTVRLSCSVPLKPEVMPGCFITLI